MVLNFTPTSRFEIIHTTRPSFSSCSIHPLSYHMHQVTETHFSTGSSASGSTKSIKVHQSRSLSPPSLNFTVPLPGSSQPENIPKYSRLPCRRIFCFSASAPWLVNSMANTLLQVYSTSLSNHNVLWSGEEDHSNYRLYRCTQVGRYQNSSSPLLWTSPITHAGISPASRKWAVHYTTALPPPCND